MIQNFRSMNHILESQKKTEEIYMGLFWNAQM